jgi:hypothetical protein
VIVSARCIHREELHKHVTELERAFDRLPGEDLNARTAVAKATVAAVGAFREQGDVAIGRLPSLRPTWDARTMRGLWRMWEFLRDDLCPGAWPAVGADVGG